MALSVSEELNLCTSESLRAENSDSKCTNIVPPLDLQQTLISDVPIQIILEYQNEENFFHPQHKVLKYKEVADRVVEALRNSLDQKTLVQILRNPPLSSAQWKAEERNWYVPNNTSSSNFMKNFDFKTSYRCKYPRLGSFEISIRFPLPPEPHQLLTGMAKPNYSRPVLVFSKLGCRRWPNVEGVLKVVQRVVSSPLDQQILNAESMIPVFMTTVTPRGGPFGPNGGGDFRRLQQPPMSFALNCSSPRNRTCHYTSTSDQSNNVHGPGNLSSRPATTGGKMQNGNQAWSNSANGSFSARPATVNGPNGSTKNMLEKDLSPKALTSTMLLTCNSDDANSKLATSPGRRISIKNSLTDAQRDFARALGDSKLRTRADALKFFHSAKSFRKYLPPFPQMFNFPQFKRALGSCFYNLEESEKVLLWNTCCRGRPEISLDDVPVNDKLVTSEDPNSPGNLKPSYGPKGTNTNSTSNSSKGLKGKGKNHQMSINTSTTISAQPPANNRANNFFTPRAKALRAQAARKLKEKESQEARQRALLEKQAKEYAEKKAKYNVNSSTSNSGPGPTTTTNNNSNLNRPPPLPPSINSNTTAPGPVSVVVPPSAITVSPVPPSTSTVSSTVVESTAPITPSTVSSTVPSTVTTFNGPVEPVSSTAPSTTFPTPRGVIDLTRAKTPGQKNQLSLSAENGIINNKAKLKPTTTRSESTNNKPTTVTNSDTTTVPPVSVTPKPLDSALHSLAMSLLQHSRDPNSPYYLWGPREYLLQSEDSDSAANIPLDIDVLQSKVGFAIRKFTPALLQLKNLGELCASLGEIWKKEEGPEGGLTTTVVNSSIETLVQCQQDGGPGPGGMGVNGEGTGSLPENMDNNVTLNGSSGIKAATVPTTVTVGNGGNGVTVTTTATAARSGSGSKTRPVRPNSAGHSRAGTSALRPGTANGTSSYKKPNQINGILNQNSNLIPAPAQDHLSASMPPGVTITDKRNDDPALLFPKMEENLTSEARKLYAELHSSYDEDEFEDEDLDDDVNQAGGAVKPKPKDENTNSRLSLKDRIKASKATDTAVTTVNTTTTSNEKVFAEDTDIAAAAKKGNHQSPQLERQDSPILIIDHGEENDYDREQGDGQTETPPEIPVTNDN